jgi:hypothetical protein
MPTQQPFLFEDPVPVPPATNTPLPNDLPALDEMFAASRRYRSSKTYQELLAFIGRFRRHAPFNAMLLYTQNPAVSYVATATEWYHKFARRPKLDARPLVILWPFSPVVFVYDLADTEGKDVPVELLRPFKTDGKLPAGHWNRLVANAWKHGIALRERPLAHQHAGSALRLTRPFASEYGRLLQDRSGPYCLSTDQTSANYLIILKQGATPEDQFTTVAHELAHIFCGHVGRTTDDWWEDRRGLGHDQEEIEAESIAYLVSKRVGLASASHEYLSNFDPAGTRELPTLSLEAICTVTGYIESLCRPGFKPREPKKSKANNKGKA